MITTTTNASKNTTNLPMISRITRPSDEEDFSAFSFDNWESGNEDLHHKLEIAMKHLYKTDSAKGAALYLEISQRFMQHLHQEFKRQEEKSYICHESGISIFLQTNKKNILAKEKTVKATYSSKV